MLRRLGSARLRIVAVTVGLVALSLLGSTLLLRQVLLTRADERVEAALAQEVEELRRLTDDGRNPRTGRPFAGDLRAIFDVFLTRNVPGEGEELYTFVGDRPYRATQTDPDPEVLRTVLELGDAEEPRRLEVAGRAILAVPIVIDGRRRGEFVASANLRAEREEITDALGVFVGVALAVLLVASIVAWLLAGRILAPLRELRDTARQISDSDLSRRLEVRGQDEIAELSRTFNAMLDRLEDAFGSQRAFIADAGHELRTPLTIIRGHLDVLGDDPREREEVLGVVSSELDRMTRLVDDLLTLAKAERPDFLRLQVVDLDLLVQEAHATARALSDERTWTLDAVGVGQLRGDGQRLTQALVALADNAVRHTTPGGTIAFGSWLRDDEARIWVSDDGQGVAERDRARVFERLSRGRRGGTAGLGLAIVRAIAEAHGGRVELRSQEGVGSRFELVLPVGGPSG